MRVISTVHKAGWDVYGERWLAGVEHWPVDTEFILYTEGFDLDHPRVKTKRIESLPRAEAFKKQYAYYKPVLWQWDIVKWCNKVFAAHDALTGYDGLALWLDADAITFKTFPEGYIESMLPDGVFLALFKRKGMEPETGFWLMDCTHRLRDAFLDTWVRWLEAGTFKTLHQWCDASTLNATLRAFEKDKLVTSVSLSGPWEKEMHPMAKVDLAHYVDHLKGFRKDLVRSPENEFREVA